MTEVGAGRRTLTLSAYVERRTGVPLGAKGSLRRMLHRSLGAGSFAAFWRFWNPVWGYYLGRYVDTPLRRLVPPWASILMTFVVSGALHDLAVIAVRRTVSVVFVPWFALMGIMVVTTTRVGYDYGSRPWPVRATINLVMVFGTLGLTLAGKAIVEGI
jgi:hypothetical protein